MVAIISRATSSPRTDDETPDRLHLATLFRFKHLQRARVRLSDKNRSVQPDYKTLEVEESGCLRLKKMT